MSVFACLALGAYGDTLGFGSGTHDGSWELCGSTKHICKIIQKHYQGSYRNIPFMREHWTVSDDTLLHLMHAKVLAKHPTLTGDELIEKIAHKLVKTVGKHCRDDTNERSFGTSTRRSYLSLKDHPTSWKEHVRYREESCGCGGAMRGMILGHRFFGRDRRATLVEVALKTGLLTNPSVVGVSGCLATAILTAFAKEDMAVQEWGKKLLEAFEQARQFFNMEHKAHASGNYHKLVESLSKEPEWLKLQKNWKMYFREIGFTAGQIPPRKTFPGTLTDRDELHKKIETAITEQQSEELTIGDRGDTSVMLALHGFLLGVRMVLDHYTNETNTTPSNLRKLYDALSEKDRQAIVDKIVEFTIIHGGDNDSTGGIALSLFGTVFGTAGVDEAQINQIEVLDKIREVASSTCFN